MANSFGIEVSSARFRAVSLADNGEVSASSAVGVELLEPRLDQLKAFIEHLVAQWGAPAALGIAIPGLVDHSGQKLIYSAHIPEHADIDLADAIASVAGVRPVIENDANAAAFGEYAAGAGRGSKSMFYVTLGEGVGGALIIDGEIWRGAGGFAGEFGCMPINSEGTRLEEVASTINIIRRTRSRFRQDSTSALNDLDEDSITLPAIIDAAAKDDDFAQMMLKRTGAYVGSAVATVINLLNVEKVVIGGEIMTAKRLVLDAVIERAHEFSFRASFDTTSIVEGSLAENAAAVGAALLARG
jgi:glucokinase